MKLCEFSTEKALDVLCELTPFVADIITDEELTEEIKKAVDPKKVKTKAEQIAVGVEKLNKIAMIVLQRKKPAVLGIIGIVNEKSAEEVAKQNILVTLSEIRDIVKDKELIAFFKSCVKPEQSE